MLLSYNVYISILLNCCTETFLSPQKFDAVVRVKCIPGIVVGQNHAFVAAAMIQIKGSMKCLFFLLSFSSWFEHSFKAS